MCDLAYLILTEDLERHVLAERQVAAVYQASGRYEPMPLPTLLESRTRFEEALVAEPVRVAVSALDREQLELRQVLGVA